MKLKYQGQVYDSYPVYDRQFQKLTGYQLIFPAGDRNVYLPLDQVEFA